MTKTEFQTLIADLIAKGYTPRAAERIARKRRKLASPAHKVAQARRCALAAEASEARSNLEALQVGH